MLNLIAFVASVTVIFVMSGWVVYDDKPLFKTRVRALLFGVVVFCPFNMNGNIYTVFGSAKSEGNIYSVFSPYQSGKNTFALVGSFYQQAENDAIVFLGLAGYQKAGNDAAVFIGLAGRQQAGHDAMMMLGFAGIQQAGSSAIGGIGLAGYQKAVNVAGAIMAGYQEVGAESRYFGFFSQLGQEPTPVQQSEKSAKK